MKARISATVLTALLLCATGAQASAGVTLKGGTLGFGADVTVAVHEKLNARLNLNKFGYSFEVKGEEDDTDITPEISLLSAGALIDWHPGAGGFRLSGGLYLNKNKLDLTADVGQTVEINGNDYTLSDLEGTVDFNSVAPYLGIGYGNAAGGDGHWHFAFDLGVIFQGAPQVDLRATVSDPALQQQLDRDIAEEEQDIEGDVEIFQFWPVVSLGVSYRF